MTPASTDRAIAILQVQAFYARADAHFAKQRLFDIALAVDDGDPMPTIVAMLRELAGQLDV